MTAEPTAADRCLDELEGAWPDPAPGAGGLRLLIGQGVGLPHLVPLALDLLERDPAAEGGLFPGDLLDAVARRGRPGPAGRAGRAVSVPPIAGAPPVLTTR
nr:contact-dependent growth inhibition system immunity protein [Streptomyces sp. TLI_235]